MLPVVMRLGAETAEEEMGEEVEADHEPGDTPLSLVSVCRVEFGHASQRVWAMISRTLRLGAWYPKEINNSKTVKFKNSKPRSERGISPDDRRSV